MKTLVLLNPQAHGGRTGPQQQALQDKLQRQGLQAQIELTTGPGAARDQVASLEPGRFDAVVAAGGDGTLFEVVNGLMDRPAGQRESLGVLPMGTGNAFARDLGLAPGDIDPAIALISRGALRPVDVAQVRTPTEQFHFINILGLGLVTEAARTAERFKGLGRGAYTLGALSAVIRLPICRLGLEIDGAPLPVRESTFVQVANSRYTGTSFMMAPQAKMDDGLLDVVVVDRLTRRRALRLFPTIYEGRHIEAPEVTVHKASSVTISEPIGAGCNVDGEFRGHTPLSIRCIPGALNLFGP